MRRPLVLAVLAAALLAAAPAAAHEEIAPTSIVVGKAAFLTLSAANEKNVNLVGLSVAAPKGATFGDGVREPAGWKANVSEDTVSWDGGVLEPGHFEQWGVELEAVDQPGTLTFTFTLRFADGTTENSQVPLTVAAPAAATPPTTAAAAAASTPTTVGSSATSIAAAPTSSPDGDHNRANLALVVAVAAGVLALAALAAAWRRRPSSATATPQDPTKEQEW